MAPIPLNDVLRVLVASDHPVVADSVAVALRHLGHEVVILDWPVAGAPAADVGVLLCDLDRSHTVEAAGSVVRRVGVPWVAVTVAPRGPAWEALEAAGVERVVSSDVGAEELAKLLVTVSVRDAGPALASRPGC
jgi:hypothetical protein